MRHTGRVVAIGIDAAEITLLNRLVRQRLLPHLAALLTLGVSGRIDSPANIGSGAVWPTFSTGTNPAAHGIYSFWDWYPERMTVAPVAIDSLRPFWQHISEADYAVGVLDVPFTFPVGLPRGVEITEWGPHDSIRRKTEVSPSALRHLVLGAANRHPFSISPLDAWGKIQDASGREKLVEHCIAGIEQRGELISRLVSELDLDLCIAVFTEVHRASHLLWHTIEPSALTPGSLEADSPAGHPALVDLYRAVDRQIGRIVDLLDADDTLLVFSLHGMKPTNGVPAVLEPLLHRWGFAVPGTWKTDSWATRARGTVDLVRRRMPESVKVVYHRHMPPAVTTQIAGPPQVPDYDWTRTTAFALPTDQHGWVRVNLEGRELRGRLAPELYDDTCQAIEHSLRSVVTDEGQPVIRQVIRLASESGSRPERLPDLVVHWNDAVIYPGTRIRTPSVPISLRAAHLTGQHSPDGFFIVRVGAGQVHSIGPSIEAKDFHLLLWRLLAGT